MSNIKISETMKDESDYRIKSYTLLVILIAIIIGCLFMVGRLGPDFFAIIAFLVIMSFPILIIFRKKIVNILPNIISDNLFEVNHDEEPKNNINYNVSKLMKQIGLYVIISILLIGSIFFINKGYKIISHSDVKKSNVNVKDFKKLFSDDYMTKEYPKAIYKILGALLFTTISGIIILEIDEF